MKRRSLLRQLAVLALLFLVMIAIAELRAPPERLSADGVRVQVIDGDSLRIGARTVRLQGIDAVELHQPCRTPEGEGWRCGIEARKALMPTDNFKPLDMAQLCANDSEAPYDVPLHRGAKRFYQEKGYLKPSEAKG